MGAAIGGYTTGTMSGISNGATAGAAIGGAIGGTIGIVFDNLPTHDDESGEAPAGSNWPQPTAPSGYNNNEAIISPSSF